MERVLLHICCGVCASPVIQRLKEEGLQAVGLFYNPNIQPEDEYQRRLGAAREVAGILDFELIEGPYEPESWHKLTKGLEGEPEGGKRCLVCFKMRLQQAYNKARMMGISRFSTTLSVSPHKNTSAVNNIANSIDPSGFLARNFKHRQGFKLAIEFAKRYNLYRQNYCGCLYSIR